MVARWGDDVHRYIHIYGYRCSSIKQLESLPVSGAAAAAAAAAGVAFVSSLAVAGACDDDVISSTSEST